MPRPRIINFEKAIEDTSGQDRALLLGNGFSIDYFDYKSLLEASGIAKRSPLGSLFTRLKTRDFELVMRSLEDAAIVEEVYDNQDQANRLKRDAKELREALIHAINKIHPKNRNEISENVPSCIKFIKTFDKIFTLNYDLLLYWVQMEDQRYFTDGFGLGKEDAGFRGPFKKEAYCNIYNIHGGLHLFKTETRDVEKHMADGDNIIKSITRTIRREKRLPLYVAEGTSKKKIAKINSVPYLRHCLDRLSESGGNMFIYGHSASQNDEHIYQAIFGSEVERIYFCVHRPTANVSSINGELQRYKATYGANRDTKIIFVDSETAHVWGAVSKAAKE